MNRLLKILVVTALIVAGSALQARADNCTFYAIAPGNLTIQSVISLRCAADRSLLVTLQNTSLTTVSSVVFNTSLPTLTNGQTAQLQGDASGRLIVTLQGQPLPTGTNSLGTVGLNAGSNDIGSIDQHGSWAISLLTGGNVIGGVTQSGSWGVQLLTGGNVIGAVTQSGGPWSVQLATGTNVVGAVTQSGTWNIAVSNFPSTQTVAGTVAVSNFPGTQAVSGTVTANQGGAPWTAKLTDGTHNVGVTSAGALQTDGSAVTQPVSGTFWQTTQPVSGTFWQSTQPVSLAALPPLASGTHDIGYTVPWTYDGCTNCPNPLTAGTVVVYSATPVIFGGATNMYNDTQSGVTECWDTSNTTTTNMPVLYNDQPGSSQTHAVPTGGVLTVHGLACEPASTPTAPGVEIYYHSI